MAENTFEEMFSKITQNPELMSKISEIAKGSSDGDLTQRLPEVIAAISPALNNEGGEEKAEKADTSSGETPNPSSNTFNLPIAKLGEKITKNSKLLMALKPYLSKERGDIIDSIVKMAQVADLMKLAK